MEKQNNINKFNNKIELFKIKKYIKNYLYIFKLIFLFLLLLCMITFKIYNKKYFNYNNKLTWSILYNIFLNLVHKYEDLINRENIIPDNSPIWVMWYQGIQDAPQIVQACIKSIIINAGKHPVFIINKYNYFKYVSLPLFILRKFNKGLFSITHFSDIIRMALLSKYGGYWIDSTYLVTSPLIKINSSFFTLKVTHCYETITKCLWAGNFIGTSKNSFLATYSYNAFLIYWRQYNSLIDYFLIDHIIYIAYQNVFKFRRFISNLPYIDCNIFSLANILNKNFDKTKDICPFNKLNKILKGKMFNKTKITFYGYIIKKYILNNTLTNSY